MNRQPRGPPRPFQFNLYNAGAFVPLFFCCRTGNSHNVKRKMNFMSELIFHFGKYKGKPLCNVPDRYLNWVIQNSKDARAVLTAEQELHRRGTALLKSGRKPLAKKPLAKKPLAKKPLAKKPTRKPLRRRNRNPQRGPRT
jgi:hypothetical protein